MSESENIKVDGKEEKHHSHHHHHHHHRHHRRYRDAVEKIRRDAKWSGL